MKSLLVGIFAFVISACAQNTPAVPGADPAILPEIPDATVIATFDDGVEFTMGEFRKFYAILPPQTQQNAVRERRTFLQHWALMRKLSLLADQQKLDRVSPSKEALAYNHMVVMSQAMLNDALNAVKVDPTEITLYYELGKENYKQVRVKTIYFAFSNTAPGGTGKQALTEDAAKSKAEKVLAEVRRGGDFVKAVKEHSDDEMSRAKDGDFATLRPNDNIPDVIKSVVFALQTGEVSEPVRQPNGFYLFRAEEVSYRPLEQVREEIYAMLKQQHYRDWLDQANREAQVTYNSPAFLGEAPPQTPRK